MSEFCPVLDEMLSKRSTVGRSGKVFTNLGSNSTLNNLRFIQRTMCDRKPTRTLEVGLAFGASTLVFCTEHERLGHVAAQQHVAIDPYQPYPPYDEAACTQLREPIWLNTSTTDRNFQSSFFLDFSKAINDLTSFISMDHTCSKTYF